MIGVLLCDKAVITWDLAKLVIQDSNKEERRQSVPLKNSRCDFKWFNHVVL